MITANKLIKDITKVLCVLVLLVMAWQQWSTFGEYKDKFAHPQDFVASVEGKDDISQYGLRVEELKKMFPGKSVLSYVGEKMVPNNGTRELHFALTQYYMAPTVLLRNIQAKDSTVYNNGASPIPFSPIECDTVIYNLYSSQKVDASTNYHLMNGFHVVKDFNNGYSVLAK